MKPRLLILLSLCALLLAACYRQTEDSFQQADSAEAVVVASPTSLPGDGPGLAGEEGTPPAYLTPEAAPGQVQPPTQDSATQVIIAATAHSQTLTPFTRPTATLSFEDGLDPTHACVYAVVAGDNLYRLSLAWGTTVQDIMNVSQLDSDALSIGQLLLRPGCEYVTPTSIPPVSPAAVIIDTATPVSAAEEPPQATEQAPAEIPIDAEPAEATEAPSEDTATPSPRVHVVSAGDTVASISLRYRVDVNALIELNNIANPNQLAVGQELKLPD